MPTKLFRVDWGHILHDYENDRLLLTVSCGRSGVFSVNLFLTASEQKTYHTGRTGYIGIQVSRFQFRPSKHEKCHAAA